MSTSSFKAAVLPELKGRHVVQTRSLPPLASGQVAIKITATAVNPVDWKIRDYGRYIEKYPAVLGTDGAGVVAELGPDLPHGWAVGDRVFFQGILNDINAATFQQYCRMPVELLSRTPKAVTDEQVAGVHLATVAALVGFFDGSGQGLAPLPWAPGGDRAGKGKAVAVIGGSSSVGQYAIQIARVAGFDRIITSSSPAHRDHLAKLGAHVVLDRSTSDAAAFAAAAGDYPLAFVFDAISLPETQHLGVQALQTAKVQGGNLVILLPPSDEAVEASQAGEYKVNVKNVLGIGSFPSLRYLSEPMAANLGGEDGWIAKGLYEPNRPAVFPGGLAAVDAALDKNRKGVSGEKIIVRPWDE